MVLADSHEAPRTPYYSGNTHDSTHDFNYGTLTLCGQPSKAVHLSRTPTALHGSTTQMLPTTPTTQPLPGITRNRFSLIRFRSPLLTESQLFSLPAGTEMFHFPTFPPTGLYIQPAVTHTTKAVHAGFPHSDILASTLGYQLHQAYRRFPRPSSAPTTKASTVRPYQLTQPPQHHPQQETASRQPISHNMSTNTTPTTKAVNAVTQIHKQSKPHTQHHPKGCHQTC